MFVSQTTVVTSLKPHVVCSTCFFLLFVVDAVLLWPHKRTSISKSSFDSDGTCGCLVVLGARCPNCVLQERKAVAVHEAVQAPLDFIM